MNTSFYGRLTRDPEIRTPQNGGNPYTTITVATQVRSKDKDGKNKSVFVDAVAFGKSGEILAQYFHKGSRIVVHGEIIEMKEYDRWYTPAYLWGKWVWRAPMSFGTVRNKSDETLKMLDEPMYGIWRRVDQIFAEGRNRHAPRKQ